jgi:5-methylcytosine-specific restriction protein A
VTAGGSDELALSYRVNPIDELRPVCPNCHAMLHQIRPALAINELQSLLQ